MKTGVFGGTFDPVHNGHLAVAEEVREGLGLAEVLFVPAGQPWLDKAGPVSPAEHRLQMVSLAIADKPYFKLSTIEIERPGSTYTVDTMADLQVRLGGDKLFFILGWGSLAGLPRWKEPSRIIGLCRLVAVPRPGYPRPDLKSLEAKIPGLSQNVILLDTPEIDISASEIRERVAQGLPISQLVPEAVERYIKEHRLYTGG